MKTVAEQLGQTPHVSPLLRRLRMLGLSDPQQLRRLAVARGCSHYRKIDDFSCPADPGPQVLSDVELAVALVSGAQELDPILVRCAAQLLSGEGVQLEKLARLAIQERAVPVVRHIAQAALELDVGRAERWQRLLFLLPPVRSLPAVGRLPHRSRFAVQTGVRRVNGRLVREITSTWLRPVRPKPLNTKTSTSPVPVQG